jgi:protein gp37
MGERSAIEWTEATWNPVTGCSKVSPGCAHCYAETLACGRLAGKPGYPGLPWTPENAAANVVLRPDRLDQPLRWRRPRMVFVNSMSDLFHEHIPDYFIAEVFGVMAAAHRHVFQVLTKRPERMRVLLNSERFWEVVEPLCMTHGEERPHVRLDYCLSNAWLGVSIENRRYVHRADLLRETPAAVRFISAEPLLGPLVPDVENRFHAGYGEHWQGNALDLTGIDWLIVGGESGPEHRPMRVEWVRDLRDACLAQAGPDLYDHPHTAFFFKQDSGLRPGQRGRFADARRWPREMPQVTPPMFTEDVA